MKMILKYFTVILIIIFFSNCKDDITTPVDSTIYYSVSGTVFEVFSSDSSLDSKNGVYIHIDKDSTISDSEGKFVFNKISKGDHTISVTLLNYKPFTKTITVSKDTSISIYLYGKDDGNPPIDTTKYYSVSGIVFDVVSNDYSPGLKNGAPIYLDNDSTFSGTDGTFIFNKVSKGDHIIRVTLPNYEPYFNSILVSRDTSIAIYLYGIKGDYFPIQDNSQSKFNYHSSASNAVYTWADSGEATWTISAAQQIGDSKIYNVFEKIIFKRKTFAPIYSEEVDSSSSTFTISESNNNIISFQSSVLDGVSFNRFLDPRQEQNGVIVKSYNNPGSVISTVNISLKKNIGLIKINQFGYGWSKTYELVQ
jgi:hypothetical protein